MKSEKILVILGVGFAAWVLAQTAFRVNSAPLTAKQILGKDTPADSNAITDSFIKQLGQQLGMDWMGINTLLAEDTETFKQGVRAGGTMERPGVIAELGNTGRLYTWIGDRPVLLPGSDGPL